MPSFCLDRRYITGPLDDDVPRCVLVDIAIGNSWEDPEKCSHNLLMYNITEGKETLDFLSNMDEKSLFKLEKDSFKPYASKIATFVNPDKSIAWSLGVLVTAFKHMLEVVNLTINNTQLSVNIMVGPKTQDSPYSYNACMLYRICRVFAIKTRPSMTFEEMTEAVILLRDIMYNRISLQGLAPTGISFSWHRHINSLLELGHKPAILEDYKGGSYDELKRFYVKLTDTTELLGQVIPSGHREAIMIAALQYGVDISSSKQPFLELDVLKQGGVYVPHDEDFKQRYARNPNWFKLTKTYAPHLAMIYDIASLDVFVRCEAMLEEEGLQFLNPQSDERRDALRNLLFQARISNTFYYGRCPDSVNHITPIELDDLNSRDADVACTVSYGSIEYNNIMVYGISELSDHFKNSKAFTNPFRVQENFSPTSIRKLKLICRDVIEREQSSRRSKSRRSSTQFTVEQRQNFETLLASIELVETTMISLSHKAEDLKVTYDKLESKEKEIVKEALTKLLHAGMYMRGWKVSCPDSVLPINSRDTITPTGKQGEIDINTSQALKDLETHLGLMCKSLGNKIKDLPLVYAQQGEGKTEYKQSNSENNGLTIWNRCEIVMRGESRDDQNSCIRLSSNWLVSSAYYYMAAIGMDPPFDITKLSKIS